MEPARNTEGRVTKGTWRRAINGEMEKCGKVWREVKAIATNRVRWKDLTEALCSTRK